MLTEIWVWYDEKVGELPTAFVAVGIGEQFDATFVNFYEWSEVHSVDWAGFTAGCGFLLRPRSPSEYSVDQALLLFNLLGVIEVEVSGMFFGTTQTRRRLSDMWKQREKKK